MRLSILPICGPWLLNFTLPGTAAIPLESSIDCQVCQPRSNHIAIASCLTCNGARHVISKSDGAIGKRDEAATIKHDNELSDDPFAAAEQEWRAVKIDNNDEHLEAEFTHIGDIYDPWTDKIEKINPRIQQDINTLAAQRMSARFGLGKLFMMGLNLIKKMFKEGKKAWKKGKNNREKY